MIENNKEVIYVVKYIKILAKVFIKLFKRYEWCKYSKCIKNKLFIEIFNN